MRQLQNRELDLSRYHAIVFDFDGTLVPCLDLRAMKRRLIEFTVRETGIAREAIESMMMVEFIDHTQNWLDQKGGGRDYFERAHALVKDIELEAADRTQLFPGTASLLSRLRKAGLRLGVVTRNCEQAVRAMYPDISNVCESVIARDQANHLKPDPRHLQQCLDELSVSATETLMVGDGIIDVQIAKDLGAASLAVTSGHNSANELEQAQPDWLLSHVNELENYL